MAYADIEMRRAKARERTRRYREKHGICYATARRRANPAIAKERQEYLKWWRHRRLREDPTYQDRLNEVARRNRLKVKAEVIGKYGGKCACCGEWELVFLNIDHPNRDGAMHRMVEWGTRGPGSRVYAWLKRRGYPKGYRVLCFNCNFATWALGKCPHKKRGS